jgi:hypothetical protein
MEGRAFLGCEGGLQLMLKDLITVVLNDTGSCKVNVLG